MADRESDPRPLRAQWEVWLTGAVFCWIGVYRRKLGVTIEEEGNSL